MKFIPFHTHSAVHTQMRGRLSPNAPPATQNLFKSLSFEANTIGMERCWLGGKSMATGRKQGSIEMLYQAFRREMENCEIAILAHYFKLHYFVSHAHELLTHAHASVSSAWQLARKKQTLVHLASASKSVKNYATKTRFWLPTLGDLNSFNICNHCRFDWPALAIFISEEPKGLM